jgi:hypothetical protein
LGDIADIAGVIIDGAKILNSNVAMPMGQRAHALPRSVVSDQDKVRGWESAQEIGFQHHRSCPICGYGVPGASNTTFNVLVNWDYGGKYNGLGLFIKDASSYVEVFEVRATYSIDVNAYFDLPAYTGDERSPVAYLEGRLEVVVSRTLTGLQYSYNRHFRISGDGSGAVRQAA